MLSTALAGVDGRSLTFSDTDEPERVLGAAVELAPVLDARHRARAGARLHRD